VTLLPFEVCDLCGDRADEYENSGSAYCCECAEHVRELAMESRGINTRRVRIEEEEHA
jgi:hypothetical protein